MSHSDDHFDEFGSHTRFKHLVLQTYFDAWNRKLLLRPAAGSMVLYVDACAGRGMDEQGNAGSPVLVAKAAAMAAAQLSEMRQERVDIRVIAIEQDESCFAALEHNLAPFGERARALRGTLSDHLGAIDREFHGVPTLFFIDPFGVKSLDGGVVRRALAGDRREALIYFADQAALRHFGAATSDMTKPEKQLAALTAELTLFPELVAAEVQTLAPKVERSKKAQGISKDNAIRILDSAYDSHAWYDVIAAVAPPERRWAFIDLYSEFLRDSCGAECVLPFPVFDDMGTRKYHLLHATKSFKGYTTMKEAIEHALKHGPLGKEVAELVHLEMRAKVNLIARRIREAFAGQRVRWAEDKKDPRAASVRRIALEGFSIMPSQLDELKAALSDVRVPNTGNTVLYEFPSAPERTTTPSRS